jgi:hypothetical protein
MTTPQAQFRYKGVDYAVDPEQLGPRDARLFRQQTGDRLLPMLQEVSQTGQVDFDLLSALIWVGMRQAGDMTVTIDDIDEDFDMSQFEAITGGDTGPEA